MCTSVHACTIARYAQVSTGACKQAPEDLQSLLTMFPSCFNAFGSHIAAL
jgi:hypothetical protein